MSRPVSVIPFDEIVPDATVRVVVIDDVQYLSIRDIIMCVCDKNMKRASEIWDRISPDRKTEVSAFCATYKFPGKGQSEQPVITFPGALKLVMFLPGEAAKNHRTAMAGILRRYFAGDATLINEIEANAASDSPVAQMARASLAAEGGAGQVADDPESRKRKRADLQLLKLETEIAGMNRRSQAELMHAQVAVVDKQLAVVDRYHSLCVDTNMDERAKLVFKDALLNMNSVLIGRPGPGPAGVAQAGADQARPLSVSQAAADLGHRFDSRQLAQVGRIASQLYAGRYGVPPRKHAQLVDGRMAEVNSYTEEDRALLKDALDMYATREEHAKRMESAGAGPAAPTSLDRWLHAQP